MFVVAGRLSSEVDLLAAIIGIAVCGLAAVAALRTRSVLNFMLSVDSSSMEVCKMIVQRYLFILEFSMKFFLPA